MIILGIDPGLAIVGYALIDFNDERNFRLLEYGCITTSSKSKNPKRLEVIHRHLDAIIEQFGPDEMAIEELFFNRNVTTAMTVSQARGVQILTARLRGLTIYEYTPMQIKQAIVGYGRAEKIQVQETVRLLTRLSELPRPDDAADAIAVALTHGFCHRRKDEFLMR